MRAVIRRILLYCRLVIRHWVSFTVTGVIAATLGLLSLTPLKINLSWTYLFLLFMVGLAVAQYQAWKDTYANITIDASPGHVSPARAFDLGVALSEKKSLHALAAMAFDSTDKRDAYVGKRDIMLNERMRAILQDFGWKMDIDDPNFDTVLVGRISSLPPEYREARRIGELVPLYAYALLVTLLKHRSDGGLALTVTDFTKVKKGELMEEIRDLEDEQKSLSIGRADLATRFFREWLNFEGERTYETWSEDLERLIHQMHEQMVAASTV